MGVEAHGDASLGALWARKPVVMPHWVHYVDTLKGGGAEMKFLDAVPTKASQAWDC